MDTKPNFIYQKKVPDNIFNEIKKIIQDQSLSNNTTLAGNLEKEFNLNKYKSILNDFIIKSITENQWLMNHLNNSRYLTFNENIHLDSLWVNFQKKHEFNPFHNHSGLFSFVLFYQIPWLKKEQLAMSPGKNSNSNVAGVLEFIYPALKGIACHSVYADRTYEKQILIFPANLYHCVYPFYGVDEYRITLSGNVTFNNAKSRPHMV